MDKTENIFHTFETYLHYYSVVDKTLFFKQEDIMNVYLKRLQSTYNSSRNTDYLSVDGRQQLA